MIMRTTTHRRLGGAARLGVAALAAVLLTVLPTAAQEKEKEKEKAEAPAKARAGTAADLQKALQRIEQLEETVKKMAAKAEAGDEADDGARGRVIDAEELQKKLEALAKTALQSRRKMDVDFQKAMEWMENGDFKAAADSYRNLAEIMRKAGDASTVTVDDDRVRALVERALKAVGRGDADAYRDFGAWVQKDPDAWRRSTEGWQALAERWQKGDAFTAFEALRAAQRARGEADIDAAGESEDDAEVDDKQRIHELQDQIADLQAQLATLNAELRKLQRRQL